MKKIIPLSAMLMASVYMTTVSADSLPVVGLLKNSTLSSLPNGLPFPNASGFASTVSTAGRIDLSNEFFQDLGTNGRRCVSCHLPSAGWTVTPLQIQAVFDLTLGGVINDGLGLGAIFRLNDGANSPNADVSTVSARRKAYSMLLTKGLIRVGIGIPANADFELIEVDDPYGYASVAELSLFRRPLPTTNLKFLSTVMWDGRETFIDTSATPDHCNIAAESGKCFQSIHFDLSDQANNATTGHAQGMPLTNDQRESIVAFETALNTAQIWDNKAGLLRTSVAFGGPQKIIAQPFYYGINDNLGDYQTSLPFNADVFNLYAGWTNSNAPSKAAIARGEHLFNDRKITISGVAGLNGSVGSPFNPPLPDTFVGSCTTCHDTPNAGNHSIVAPLNIGLADASKRTPDMPLYTLRNKETGAVVQTTDPGRALITGKFVDIGKFKGPILRGLAARAPYFHNGLAVDLDTVVNFYNDRFNMKLTNQEHRDLVAFLRTL